MKFLSPAFGLLVGILILVVMQLRQLEYAQDACHRALNYAAGAMLAEDADHTVAWWGVQDACK